MIGCEEREQLETVCLKVIVKKHQRRKYGCRCCGETIRLAPAPPQAIEKSLAGPNLLAQVLVDKYGDHLPLYRQQQRFKRHGLSLSRATLWNWIRLSAMSLAPLVEAMKKDLLVLDHLFSDDTPMPTQRHGFPERSGLQRHVMWVYTGLSSQGHALVLYDSTTSRGAEHPSRFLKDFSGYLQADAYGGYRPLLKDRPSIYLVGCMAHARRKFREAIIANPSSLAQEMVDAMGRLYKLEKVFKEKRLSPLLKAQQRQDKAVPILQDINRLADTSSSSRTSQNTVR